MAGAADLVAALTGGKALEQDAYGTAAARIMQARNAQAQMDKRVQDAALVRDQLRSRQNFENTFTPDMSHPDALKYAILADLADQVKYGQESIGVGQQNDARALAAIEALKAAPGPDRFNTQNAIASGKLLTAGNVNVQDQSNANYAKTIMETLAQGALRDERLAGEAKDLADIATDAQGNVIPDMETLPTALSSLLYMPPKELPVTWDNPGLFTGDTTENLPLSDPRAAEKWAGMPTDEKAGLMQDLAPEFLSWRTANIMRDPSLQDVDIAVGKFLESKGITQTGRQAQEDRNKRTVYNTVADLQADIAAGVVKSGDTIQTPEGPRVVK